MHCLLTLEEPDDAAKKLNLISLTIILTLSRVKLENFQSWNFPTIYNVSFKAAILADLSFILITENFIYHAYNRCNLISLSSKLNELF